MRTEWSEVGRGSGEDGRVVNGSAVDGRAVGGSEVDGCAVDRIAVDGIGIGARLGTDCSRMKAMRKRRTLHVGAQKRSTSV